ncbi:MAG: DUF2157 domain-containing protein [Bryobacteraceae bacterium]
MESYSNQREAQARADRIRLFRDELADLEREGGLTLTPHQRTRLEAHVETTLSALAAQFDVDTSASQKQISLGMQIATALGGLALCLAVFFFFMQIWGHLILPVRWAVLAASPLAALAGAAWTARRERTLYYAALLSLVALAALITDTLIVGAAFNIAPSPNALLVWGCFALLVAYALGIRLMLAAGLLLTGAFVCALATRLNGLAWEQVFDRPEPVIFCGIAVVLAGQFIPHRRFPEFVPVYEFIGALAALVTLVFLSLNGRVSYLDMDPKNIERLYEVVGIVVTTLAIWRGVDRGSAVLVNMGSSTLAIFLLIRWSHWLWDLLPRYVFFLSLGLVAVGLIALFKRLRGRFQREDET